MRTLALSALALVLVALTVLCVVVGGAPGGATTPCDGPSTPAAGAVDPAGGVGSTETQPAAGPR